MTELSTDDPITPIDNISENDFDPQIEVDNDNDSDFELDNDLQLEIENDNESNNDSNDSEMIMWRELSDFF